MSFLKKLMFWKKDDEFNFDELAHKEMNSSQLLQDNLGFEQQDDKAFNEKPLFGDTLGTEDPFAQPEESAPPQPRYQQSQPQESSGRDMELVNSKLDTIKALLTTMDQRMAHLERSHSEKKERLW